MHRLLILAALVAALVMPFITADGESYESDISSTSALISFKRRSYCQEYRQWQCRDGTCISSDAICDGVEDCSDKSDETHALCRNMECQPNWFRCTYGACVSGDAPCNGVKDCADNSDELMPACRNETEHFGRTFKCVNGEFIPAHARCDGVKDCSDGSDETLVSCGRNSCPSFYFQCAYGACVNRGAECNEIVECADESDENDILCNRTSQVTTTRRPSSSKRCQLPQYPAHGSYKTHGVTVSPGHAVGDVILHFTCNQEYMLVGSAQVRCKDGEWLDQLPRCERSCKLIQKPNIKYRCVLTGDSEGTRKCREYEPVGTQANHTCAPHYRSDDDYLGFMECTPSGWDNVPRCKPDCGKLAPEGTAMIITGRSAKTGELPWHVGIYQKNYNLTEKAVYYLQVCGGTLVSTTVVLSAAHCFWEGDYPLPATGYAVAAGKLYRDWNDPRDKAQKFDVKDLFLTGVFMGVNNQYQGDLAMLVLDRPIQQEPRIGPVCLSFSENLALEQIHSGRLGKVAGWGLTSANGEASPTLKVVELPYVGIFECKEKSQERFRQFITSDKFCAGYENDTALCTGDSGGGLVFKKAGTERYYLRGIVSTAHQAMDKCDSKSFTTFTDIMSQKDFLNSRLRVEY